MKFLSGKELAQKKALLIEQYPPGTRIELINLCNDERDMTPGLLGTVDYIDDQPALHMKWDNGRTLALLPDEDSFRKLPKLDVSKYEYLIGMTSGNDERLKNTPESVAEFICRAGKHEDVIITTPNFNKVLNTFGIYVDKCNDPVFMEKLRLVLVSKQLEVESFEDTEASEGEIEDQSENEEIMMT